MKFVFLSYVNTPEFKRPEDWIRRISGYFGVLEALSRQHTVISIEQIDYDGPYDLNGVHYEFMNFHRPVLRWPAKLHRRIRQLHPDVVIVHGLNFPLQIIHLRLALGSSTRILLQSHANRPPSGWRRTIQKLADRCTDAYLFTSISMASEWIDKGLIRNTKKIKELMVASSGFTPIGKADARQKTGMTGDPAFVWAGRLNANKDPFTMIDAFLQFAKSHPNARLYMIYHTEEFLSAVQQRLEKIHPINPIILVGKVAHTAMPYWFSGADFIVSTSHAEAFGVAVSEGMSCGCIPIVTDIPSYRKLTGEGACGFLFEAGNADDLLHALLQCSSMDIRTEREKVRKVFDKTLSFRAIAGQLDEIARSL